MIQLMALLLLCTLCVQITTACPDHGSRHGQCLQGELPQHSALACNLLHEAVLACRKVAGWAPEAQAPAAERPTGEEGEGEGEGEGEAGCEGWCRTPGALPS